MVSTAAFLPHGSTNGPAACWEWPLLPEQWEMRSASSSRATSVHISVTAGCTCPCPRHGKCLKQLKEHRSVTDEHRLTKLLSHRWFYDERFWLTEVTSLEQESVSALIMKSGKAQFRGREWRNHWTGTAPYQNWIRIVFQVWLNSFRWGKEKCGAVVQVP